MQKLAKLKPLIAHASTIIFIVGFFFDAFILPDVNDPLVKYIGSAYLLCVAVCISLREFIITRNTASKLEQRLFSWLTFGIAYFMGSSLSFIFVYYMRSAELSVSWPFFVLMLGIMIINEFTSSHSFRFLLDITVLFISATFFSIFNTPLVIKEVSDQVFFLSIFISVITLIVFSYLVSFTSELAERSTKKIQALALCIPLCILFLNFAHILPAVPLSLKDAGIYHFISKEADGNFSLQEKETVRFPFFQTVTFHKKDQSDGVYFFSSVQAPAFITAPLSHVWEEYDMTTKTWTERSRVTFSINGGREDGYRAYSYKENVTPGLWRVTVYAGSKRIVGRMKFNVE